MRKQIILIILVMIFSIGIWAQNIPDCIPVVKTTNNQINQVVVSSNVGSAIIAWQDGRAGNYNIYAQRFSNNGVALWPNYITGKLIIGGASEKVNLDMIDDGAGGAIIAWQDSRNGNMDIYATRIDTNGDIVGGWSSTGLAVCTDLSVQSPPKLYRDEEGGAFVTWSDNRGGDYDIYALRINPNSTLTGNVNGTRLQLLAESANQVNPAITTDGAHGAIIAYEQYTGPGDYDIYAQRIDPNCNNLWIGGGVPVTTANQNQVNPRLINDDIGSAIIVWEDYVNTTWDIYAQRVASVPATGAIQWTANGVAIMAIALDQINPVIVTAGEYAAIIVWEHYLSATDSNIYAQKIYGGVAGTTASLMWLGTGVPVSTIHDSIQRRPQAISDGQGGVIVIYETEELYAANGVDVYANRINTDGLYVGSGQVGGYEVCTWDTDQSYPMLTYSISAVDNAIYAWRDKRNEDDQPGIHDIYTLGLEENTLPVELSSFTVTVTADNFAQLKWITQSETGVMGFYIHRAESDLLTDAMQISNLIEGTNTSETHSYTFLDSDVSSDHTYYYWLQGMDYDGHTFYTDPISIQINEDNGGEIPQIPLQTELLNAFPNPFNPNTNIRYSLKEAGAVKIEIFNLRGQIIRTYEQNHPTIGYYSIVFDGLDSNGNSLASGIYYYRMSSHKYQSTKKMLLTK
jgi:hypothetical protein